MKQEIIDILNEHTRPIYDNGNCVHESEFDQIADLIEELYAHKKHIEDMPEWSHNTQLVVKTCKDPKSNPELLKDALYEVCDQTHSSCNGDCPVFVINGHKVPEVPEGDDTFGGCSCFKLGGEMLKFILKNSK